MKNLYLICFLAFIANCCFSQEPIPYPVPYQNLGSGGTAVRDSGGVFVRNTLGIPMFPDTTSANTGALFNGQRFSPKFYPFTVIGTSDSNFLWYRNAEATQWIRLAQGSGGKIYTADRGVKIIDPNLSLIRLVDTFQGAATKFQWLYDKGAFRAGTVDGLQWDVDSIGIQSFAGGLNNKAIGVSTVAFGSSNLSRGNFAFSAGNNNQSIGSLSTVFGQNNFNYGTGGTIFGQNNIASGDFSFISGANHTVSGLFYSSILGGNQNSVLSSKSAIIGGQSNNIYNSEGIGDESVIIGGQFNKIDLFGSVIAGAGRSVVRHTTDFNGYNFISGYENATASDQSSVFGYNNISKSWAQTVVGMFNDTTGDQTPSASPINRNNIAFEVGNGQYTGVGAGRRSSALRVKLNGEISAPGGYYFNNVSEDSVLTIDYTTKALKMKLAGGGGSQDLQSVTSIGATTTDDVNVGSNFKAISNVDPDAFIHLNVTSESVPELQIQSADGQYIKLTAATNGKLTFNDGTFSRDITGAGLTGNQTATFSDHSGTIAFIAADSTDDPQNIIWQDTDGLLHKSAVLGGGVTQSALDDTASSIRSAIGGGSPSTFNLENPYLYYTDVDSTIRVDTTNLVTYRAMDSARGYKVYTAILNEFAPETITSGTLRIGGHYTITTYVPGDDFTNVGAESNADGVEFDATGNTPADWSNGSTLDYNGAPIATVLQNTLGGDVVWTYDNTGEYFAELTGAFTANKTTTIQGVLMLYAVDPGSYKIYGKRENNDQYKITSSDAGVAADGLLTDYTIEIRVYNP